MMVAWGLPDVKMVGVEAQALSYGLARRSLAYNGVTSRVEVRHGDLREADMVPEGSVFDLVTGTPPYIPLGHGSVSKKEQCGPCRFEYRGGVEDYCDAAKRCRSSIVGHKNLLSILEKPAAGSKHQCPTGVRTSMKIAGLGKKKWTYYAEWFACLFRSSSECRMNSGIV